MAPYTEIYTEQQIGYPVVELEAVDIEFRLLLKVSTRDRIINPRALGRGLILSTIFKIIIFSLRHKKM